MATTTLEFSLTFGVPTSILYGALTNQLELSKITRCPAVFKNEVDGEFVLFGGKIVGKNKTLTKDALIVQDWKMNDWNSFSTVRYEFDETDDNEVELTIKQTNIPSDANLNSVKGGWIGMIFEPLSGILGYPITERNL